MVLFPFAGPVSISLAAAGYGVKGGELKIGVTVLRGQETRVSAKRTAVASAEAD
jgi:hypothetical protein